MQSKIAKGLKTNVEFECFRINPKMQAKKYVKERF